MIWIFRVVLVAALVFFVALRVDLSNLWEHVTARLFLGFAASQPVVILSFLVFAKRLQLLVHDPKISLGPAFNAFVLPIGLNIVVPVRLSEVAKPAYLSSVWNVPIATSLSAMVVERSFDVVVVGSLALLVLPSAYLSANVVAIIALILAAAAVLPWLATFAKRSLPKSESRLADLARSFLEGISPVRRRGRYLQVLALSAAGWTVSMVSVYIALSIAGSRSITLFEGGAVFVLTLIGGLIAILPAGMGTFQAAAMIGLVAIGFSVEEGLVLGIMLQAQAMFYACLHTAIMIARCNFDLGRLRDFALRR